jgi:hypothetical protein
MSATSQPTKRLKIATILMVIAGGLPLMLGSKNYLFFWSSLWNPDAVWTARDFGPGNYTLNQIKACNTQLAADYVLDIQVETTNLTISGTMIILIALFGLREGRKWAWFLLLGIGLWGGLNDLVAMLRANVFPLAAIANAVGMMSCIISIPDVFGVKFSGQNAP